MPSSNVSSIVGGKVSSKVSSNVSEDRGAANKRATATLGVSMRTFVLVTQVK